MVAPIPSAGTAKPLSPHPEGPQGTRWSFSLRGLLIFIGWFSLYLALGMSGQEGLLGLFLLGTIVCLLVAGIRKFRDLKRRKGLVLGIAATVIALCLAPFFVYRSRESFRCSTCFSWRSVRQWHVGLWSGGDLPLSPRSVFERPSQVCRDYFDASHVHVWSFSQGSPYFMLGTRWGGCALGSGVSPNDLVMWYEDSPEFRTFFRKKTADLPPDEIRGLFQLPDLEFPETTAILDEFRPAAARR